MATSELERISNMESHLDEVTALTTKIQEQLDAAKALKEHAQALFQYYGSEDWHADRDLTLPKGFNAGVLRDAAFDMLELGTDILKTWI